MHHHGTTADAPKDRDGHVENIDKIKDRQKLLITVSYREYKNLKQKVMVTIAIEENFTEENQRIWKETFIS